MKQAFTLLELIFVIIVIGIIATVALPKLKRNDLPKAAAQVVSHIRYTQHLAMLDDKFDINDNDWYMNRWQIIFANSTTITKPGVTYSIFSDYSASGNPDVIEMAKNPINTSLILSGGHSNLVASNDKFLTNTLNLTATYGIISYSLNDGCSGARISFDHIGRPIEGNLTTMIGAYTAGTNRLISQQCVIVLKNKDDQNISIAIEPETGYTHIL